MWVRANGDGSVRVGGLLSCRTLCAVFSAGRQTPAASAVCVPRVSVRVLLLRADPVSAQGNSGGVPVSTWHRLNSSRLCVTHSVSVFIRETPVSRLNGSLEDSGDRVLWDTRQRREERLEESQQSAVRLENFGDRVLWDMRQRREEEKRLREIQQQLELLEESQQSASEDQLKNLLLECEEEVLRSPSGSSSLGTISALLASPCLSSCDLTEILTNTLKTP